jgi:hypothetical protein
VEGKAVASKNATRHGLLSRLEVLPHVETVKEWEIHFRRTMEDLRPGTYIERLFAERVALNLWRLLRVARYERDATAITAEQRARPPAAVSSRLQDFEKLADFVRRLPDLPDEEETDRKLTVVLLVNVANTVRGVDFWGDEAKGKKPDVELPGGVPDNKVFGVQGMPFTRSLYEIDWDARLLRKVLADIANHVGRSLEGLLAQEEEAARTEADKERKELERVGDRLMRLNALLSRGELEKVLRYETHLDRSLLRYLHELHHLQAVRAGETVQPPAAVDVTVNVHPMSPPADGERPQGFMLNDPSPLFAKRTQGQGSS